jgi:arabinoxylan arabinofuranohydrolase
VDSSDADALDAWLLKGEKFPVAERVSVKLDFTELEKKFSGVTMGKSWKYDGENNPLTTQRFGADPGWMVYGDRLYIYTTNDAFEYNGNQIKENSYYCGTINCISSSDLVNWTDHGAIPVAAKFPGLSNAPAKWASRSWAPDAAWKTINGKDQFFLYFANNGSGVGVLQADSPTGPFRDPIGHELANSSVPGGQGVLWQFDPGVYYDPETDEGYIAYGGGVPEGQSANPGTGRIGKLGKDMISIDGSFQKMETPYLFEDSSLIKVGDTWYYSYCSNWSGGGTVNGVSFGSADICYMTSKNPLGPWNASTLAGVVFKNTGSQRIDKGGNNHHSIIFFKDKYYVAYHARQQEMRMGVNGGNGWNYRSTHLNEASFSGGKFSCTGDMKGITKQLEYVNPYETVQAETMAQQAGIQISGLGNTVVSEVDPGDWIRVKGVNFSNGCSKFNVRASSKNGAVIKAMDGQGNAFAYAEIPAGSNMTDLSFDCNSINGVNDITFEFSGQLEFDSWSFK